MVQINNVRPMGKGELHAGFNVWDAIGMQRVGSLLRENGYDVSTIQQLQEPLGRIIYETIEQRPDVVGISTWTCTWEQDKEFIKEIKKQSPNTLIVVGGYHISTSPESLLDCEADYGIKGEGEMPMYNLLSALNKGKDTHNVDGLVYRSGDGIKSNPISRVKDLDSLPDPIRDWDILRFTNVSSLMYPAVKDQKGVVNIDYSRGCKFACKYCDSQAVWGQSITYRSPERFVNELKNLNFYFRTNTAFLTDLTFNCNREKAETLCDKVADADLGVKFHIQVRLTTPSGTPLVDYKLLKKIKEMGGQKLAWGIETFDDKAQKDIRKSVDSGYIKEVFDMVSDLGMFNRCLMMLGHKDESWETIEKTIDKLKYLTPDETRLAFMTPFPNTPLWHEMKEQGLLLTEDFSKLTTNRPVIKAKISTEELIQARKDVNSAFYNSAEYNAMVQKKIDTFPHLKESYGEFFELLSKFDIKKDKDSYKYGHPLDYIGYL
jgi:anaerobic magnesium-protoporphyrin IX monomethyl ester cyclase